MIIRALFTAIFLLWSSGIFADSFPFIGMVTKDGANVRAGSNTNFESLYQAKKGEKIIVQGKVYSWYKIALPKDKTCFISAKYVKATGVDIGIVEANRVNIRAKPGENYTIIGQARQGETVKISGKSDGWYAISPLDNCYGWIHEKLVKFYSSFDPEESRKILKIELLTEKEETPLEEVKMEAVSALPKPPPVESLELVGILEPRGKVLNRRGTHKLIIEGKPAYYLEGQPEVLNKFIHFKVKVVVDKKETAGDLPLVSVKSIESIP